MKINAQIVAEAADWFIELNSGEPTLKLRQEFDAWLRRSPEHLRAYLELLPGWEDGAALPAGRSIEEADLIAMGQRDDANVVSLARVPTTQVNLPRARSSVLLAFAATVAGLAIAAAVAWSAFFQGRYTTEIGEHRTVALDDGSTVELNADSRIRVHLTSGTRSVELLQGQALFNVAKDATRPFVVEAAGTWVRAVGTQFDVNRRLQSTVVTVVEGTVAVSRSTPAAALQPAAAEPRSMTSSDGVLVTAGEQVTVKPAGTTPSSSVAPKSVQLMQRAQRRLVFDDSTLAEVVEEFNRYNKQRLTIVSPELESFPITATFSSADPTSLVRFLEAQPTIRITVKGHAFEISSSI